MEHPDEGDNGVEMNEATETGPVACGARRPGMLLVAVLAVLGSLLTWPLATRVEAASAKITICHRTHSTTNPYRRITVSQNAVQNNRHGGHDLPNGSTNPDVFDPTFDYQPNNKYWGDIIPGATNDGGLYNGSSSIALNWTTAGQALFFDALGYCKPMSPKQFYDSEILAGVPAADVIADLNDQDANEDLALLAALGGSFTLGNLDSWSTAVSVTTNDATSVLANSATLNGSLTVGPTSTVTGFEWGTSPTLTTSTTVGATPATVTNTSSVSAELTGLTPGTTYYFRVTGTTNAGTDTEGILIGEILSFTTPTVDGSSSSTSSSTPDSSTPDSSTPDSSTPDPSTPDPSTPDPSTPDPSTPDPSTPGPSAPDSSSTATSSTAPVVPTTAASPSPTDTATSTTAPAAAPDGAGLGAVRGVIWFDRDHDGMMDPGEWVLPGVPVTLELIGHDSLQMQRILLSDATTRTTTTRLDGTYEFNGLPAGRYRVRATAAIAGFEYTGDTDALAGGSAAGTDWIVEVQVPIGGVGIADYAGLGKGILAGTVYELQTFAAASFATVTCRWGGFDDVLGTEDDVSFVVTADVDGRFELAGVPYGRYSCSGLDAAGRASSAVTADVFGPERVLTELPVTPLAPTGLLPSTGGSPMGQLLFALGLCGFGLLMVHLRRRPANG
jgi:SdrD B-like domain